MTWLEFTVSVIVTAATYGAGPMLLALLRNKPLRPRYLRVFSIVYTAAVWIAWQMLTYDGNSVQTAPALLWGYVFYRLTKGILEEKAASAIPQQEQPGEWCYICPKCGRPVQKGEACACEPAQPQAGQREAVSEGQAPGHGEGEQRREVQEKAGLVTKFSHILSIVLIFCICILGYYAFYITGEKNSLAVRNEALEIRAENLSKENQSLKIKTLQLQDEAEELTDRVEDLAYYLPDAIFLHDNIGFLVSDSNSYHSYGCPIFQKSDEYWAHNIEYCEYLGYFPCRNCW